MFNETGSWPLRHKIPTGIKTIDLAIGGGFPSGSLVLLAGRPGLGKLDFWHTIAYRNAAMKEGLIPVPEAPDVLLPEHIWYVSLRNSKEDVLADVKAKYVEDFFKIYSKHVSFADFIPEYFSIERSAFDTDESAFADRTEFSFTPPSVFARVMERASVEGQEPGHLFKLLRKISDFLKTEAKNSIIIFESLNELIRASPRDERDLLSSLLYLRRENLTKWGSVIYTYMSEGVFPRQLEESMSSTIDNVLTFEGESVQGAGRVMRIRKFKGHPSGMIANTRYEIFPSSYGAEILRVGLIDV